MSQSKKVILGIDPGWSSCGVSAVYVDKVIFSTNFVPKEYGSPFNFISQGLLPKLEDMQVTDLYIERYVAYAGVLSSASEEILMNIGALVYAFEEQGAEIHPLRAIDWKQRLCKYLVRTKGFNNPYPSFDKKFSVLAAQVMSGNKGIITDHEADAICLSFMKEVDEYESKSASRKIKASTG